MQAKKDGPPTTFTAASHAYIRGGAKSEAVRDQRESEVPKISPVM